MSKDYLFDYFNFYVKSYRFLSIIILRRCDMVRVVVEKEWGEWKVKVETEDGNTVCDIYADVIEVKVNDTEYYLTNGQEE